MNTGILENPNKIKPLYHGLKVDWKDYMQLEEDGFKYDVIEGVMLMTPSPNFEHGNQEIQFGYFLKKYLLKNPLGKAVVEVDVYLPDNGDPLRPDISFLLNENLSYAKTHIYGTPDLVCEILSDSTAERDLGIKADRYLKCSVKEYWIIDPRDQSMQVWFNRISKWEKKIGKKLKSELLSGFTLTSKKMFEN